MGRNITWHDALRRDAGSCVDEEFAAAWSSAHQLASRTRVDPAFRVIFGSLTQLSSISADIGGAEAASHPVGFPWIVEAGGGRLGLPARPEVLHRRGRVLRSRRSHGVV